MVEYVTVNTLLLFTFLAVAGGWFWTGALTNALQSYVDLFFFTLNLALN